MKMKSGNPFFFLFFSLFFMCASLSFSHMCTKVTVFVEFAVCKFSSTVRDIGICRHTSLVQTHKCSFLIYGSTYFKKIKLCLLNSSMCAALAEIQLEVHHVFISQKLKKLKEEESLPFGPSYAAHCV